jgi:hypothetical protein
VRPQARHKGDLTKRIKAAFSAEPSARMAAESEQALPALPTPINPRSLGR